MRFRRLAPLVAALICLGACQHPDIPTPAGQPPEDEVWLTAEQMAKSQVRTAQAQIQSLPQAVTVGGRIGFDDSRVAHVLSPVTGRVARVIAQPGQQVKQGAPLIAIVSPDVGSAVSDLVKAQADLTAAQHDYSRQKAIVEAQAGPQRDLEASEDNYRKAKAEMERAHKKASMLHSGAINSVTQEYALPSPIEGTVIARYANPGMEVQGQYSGGTSVELFTIGDIDSVWLYADVAQEDLPRVQLGAEMTVQVVAYPTRVFHGHVEWMSDTLDPALRTVRIRCALPNPEHLLKPEMFGSVGIATDPLSALALPRDAIVAINDQMFVFVAAGTRPDGRSIFKRRHVHTGAESTDGRIQVLDGVTAGETVVIEGSVTREEPNDEAWMTPEQFNSAGIKFSIIQEQDFEDRISIGGRLTFDDARVSHVFSPVTGRVTKVLAQPGQKLKRGTALLTVASPDVGSAFSDTVKAQADLVAAEHEYQRQKELYAEHAGAQKDLETAQDNYSKAKAEMDRALQKTRLLRSGSVDTVTQEYTLKSPLDGEVVARTVSPGQEIQGQYSAGASALELFTIGDLSELWLVGDVYEADLPQIRKGATVSVQLPAYPDKKFQGRVDWVSDVLDPVTHQAKVRCVLANPDRLLRPEMYEAVSISAPVEHALAVPRESVLRIGNQTYVFVSGGKTVDGRLIFRRRKVTVSGETTGKLVPVVSGLKAGENVAVDNSIFLLGLL